MDISLEEARVNGEVLFVSPATCDSDKKRTLIGKWGYVPHMPYLPLLLYNKANREAQRDSGRNRV